LKKPISIAALIITAFVDTCQGRWLGVHSAMRQVGICSAGVSSVQVPVPAIPVASALNPQDVADACSSARWLLDARGERA
jgi:hypothetical protein